VALPSLVGAGLLVALIWVGALALRRAQMQTVVSYRVEALRNHLKAQGDSLSGLGQMLAKSWTAQQDAGQGSEDAVRAALPLLRQQGLVSNLILASPEGRFLSLVRSMAGWDLLEGGPGLGRNGMARLTKRVDVPGGRTEWVRLPADFPSDRPWFKQGMALERSGWMAQPYRFAGTEAGGLSYLVPVFDLQGRRVGLVCLDSTQTRVSRAMEAVLDNPFCRAMITDASRRVIVPPQWPTMPDPGDTFQVLSLEEIPWTHALLAGQAEEGKPVMATAVIGGLNFITQRAPLDLGSGLHGELWVAFPMTRPEPFLLRAGLIATLLLSLLMLAWLAYLKMMSQRYEAPMRHLMNSAEAVRKGLEIPDLDSDILEIRQLGHSLRQMGETMKANQSLGDQIIPLQRFEIISALSGGVTHDVNNVLSILMLRIERALERGWQPRTVEDLREGLAAAQQCIAVNRQLLELGRKEKEPAHRLDLNECVKDASLLVRPALGRDLVLEMNLTEKRLPVVIRAVELAQAILNLALNARDAMPEGGLVQLRTRREGDEAFLEMEDGGEGIPEALWARIFEPYFTTKPPGKGTGLGLAVVKRVVERHHGRIELYRRPGRGQGFRLAFPLTWEGEP
jgi:signal transduction histidine kinase